MDKTGSGKRFNNGKVRVDLAMTPHAVNEIGKVMTIGGVKYGDRNWEYGMVWSKPFASMMRHIRQWLMCEDFDDETKAHHMAHAAANAIFLTEYVKTFPQGDDRHKPFLSDTKIGLDIDEVCADFVSGYMKRAGLEERPRFWNFSKDTLAIYADLCEEEDFWLGLDPIESPEALTFEPTVYITARPLPLDWTYRWLENNGFPFAPVVSSHSDGRSKSDICKEYELDIFVDDNFSHFKEINKGGTFCYLRTAAHNERYQVGHHRIGSLRELSYHEGMNGGAWSQEYARLLEEAKKKGLEESLAGLAIAVKDEKENV